MKAFAKALAAIMLMTIVIFAAGCSKDPDNSQNTNNNTNPVVNNSKPKVGAVEITDVTSTSVTCVAKILSEGESAIIERGICWSKTGTPLTTGPHNAVEGGVGEFSCEITGLEPGTTYKICGYAINSAGVAYGSEVSFTTPTGSLMIKVIEENGFVHDGSIIDNTLPFKFGFEMSSSVGLNNLEITYSMVIMGFSVENKLAEVSFNGETSYTYISDELNIPFTSQITFTATVWDVESRSSTASFTIQLIQIAPTISIISEDGYLTDNQVVYTDIEYKFGFHMSSSVAELSSLTITFDYGDNPQVYDEMDLSGMFEYNYVGNVIFADSRENIGECTITAVVTDANGKSSAASFTVFLNQDQMLIQSPFEWSRVGGAPGIGLEEFGLEWTHNSKDVFARINPLDGVLLFQFDPSVWWQVNTEAEKEALFSSALETMSPEYEYAHVSIMNSADYDDVIGTVLPDGTMCLIHVTHFTVYSEKAWCFIITGEWK